MCIAMHIADRRAGEIYTLKKYVLSLLARRSKRIKLSFLDFSRDYPKKLPLDKPSAYRYPETTVQFLSFGETQDFSCFFPKNACFRCGKLVLKGESENCVLKRLPERRPFLRLAVCAHFDAFNFGEVICQNVANPGILVLPSLTARLPSCRSIGAQQPAWLTIHIRTRAARLP
jgi:hypothetical protein